MDQTLTRAAKHHDIKILPQFFKDTSCGRKSFEIRKDDRDYQIGDIVTMHEWTPDVGYTGRQQTIIITYVLRGYPEYGLMDGYCVFGWIPQNADDAILEELRIAKEKQIKKVPDYEGDGYSEGKMVYDTWICPCCGTHYEVDYDNYDYCPNCGQAIDLMGGIDDETD